MSILCSGNYRLSTLLATWVIQVVQISLNIVLLLRYLALKYQAGRYTVAAGVHIALSGFVDAIN
jgi:hypothetical protein